MNSYISLCLSCSHTLFFFSADLKWWAQHQCCHLHLSLSTLSAFLSCSGIFWCPWKKKKIPWENRRNFWTCVSCTFLSLAQLSDLVYDGVLITGGGRAAWIIDRLIFHLVLYVVMGKKRTHLSLKKDNPLGHIFQFKKSTLIKNVQQRMHRFEFGLQRNSKMQFVAESNPDCSERSSQGLPVGLRGSGSDWLLTEADQTNTRTSERSPCRRATWSNALHSMQKRFHAWAHHPAWTRVCCGLGQERGMLGFIIRVQASPLASVISHICPKAPRQAGREEGGNERTDGNTEMPRSQLTWATQHPEWETKGDHWDWWTHFSPCLHFITLDKLKYPRRASGAEDTPTDTRRSTIISPQFNTMTKEWLRGR